MPARLSKRQQRELEELESAADALQLAPSSEEEDIPIRAPVKSGFAALLDNDDDDEDEAADSQTPAPKSKKPKKKKKKDHGAGPSTLAAKGANPLPSSPGAASPSPSPAPGPSKKEWKALKKQKAKEKKDGKDDIDRVLQELSVKYPDLQSAPHASTGKSKASRSLPHELHALLAVSISHLDTEAEMRKFFGAKVISASKSAGSSNARRQPTNQRSNLTRPKPTWWPAKLREGLTLRKLSDLELEAKTTRSPWSDDDENWWTVDYSKRYKGVTKMFLQVVLSGDPEGFFTIVRQAPWHADTLLQLAELYGHREEHSQAADFIERAMFTYERAFVGAFTFTNGVNRLDFDHVENRPFFLAVHRQVIDLQRRGIPRTAFEFARVLYGLDPWSDPHGALLHLDFLAIKAGMSQWLLDMFDLLESDDASRDSATILALPGWAYTRALAWRVQGNDAQSTQALRSAILDFPSVVPLLADKAEITLSADIRGKGAFRIFTRDSYASLEESLLHLLSHLYVQRSSSLWKDPNHAPWFASTVASVTSEGKLPSASTNTPGFQRLAAHTRSTPGFPTSVYRHVVVLGAPAQRLLAYIPQAVLTSNSLACDPLPPPSAASRYDDAFFRGAEDAFASAVRPRRNAAADQRMLERLVPDPVFRRQLQDFFAAHPRLLEQFPGGVVQFAQVAGNLPEEVLQDLMMAQVMHDEAAPRQGQGGMPGGMPGEDMVLLDFPEEPDMEPEEGDVPALADAEEEDEEDEDEEEDEEQQEVAPMPVRVLRNIINRFWGGGPAEEEESSEDEGEPETEDLDGID
ncbi:DUF654-domain-containing protein [Artomyces pyxidatus]|uniref:DUF654-domain-containing protein n=1 Tax=Artomyces pyxidatus TaxID=48021 RepID=A0ACB8SSJ2_9AGAM|nr:DUF654-domain-containing protein [Artomyces pyxidatus]